MSARSQQQPVDVDGAPESWFRPDSTILEQVNKWIESGHPGNCTKRTGLLLSCRTHRYTVTTQKLVAHCIKEHGKGIELLCEMYRQGHFPLDEIEVGLADSIRTAQRRLCEEILDAGLASDDDAYVHAVGLVARHLDVKHLSQVWNEIWMDGRARRASRAAGAVFRAAAFSASGSRLAIDLTATRMDEVFQLIPEVLVFCLVHSPEMRPVQDAAFQTLISTHGTNAASLILALSQYAHPIPKCVSQATRLLVNSDPENTIALVGLALCLELDPQYAIPIIADKVNSGKPIHPHNHFLEWSIQNTDQKSLFHAMASDAIRRDSVWHPTLAGAHHDLITDLDAVIQWTEKTAQNKEASRYNAALITEYLSGPPQSAATEKMKKLVDLAHTLHAKYGSQDEKFVCKEMSLTDPKLPSYDELVAIALAKDVVYPSESIDAEKLLANLKALPFTYRALGESQLDSEVRKGSLPPFAEFYASDVGSEDAKFIRAQEFRKAWEERFSKISKAGIAVPTQRLRTNRYIWSEMRILSQLIDLFEVEYEPKGVPGMGTKRPEFLLKSPEGSIIFEVAAIGAKPEDVRVGAKVSTGGTAKKTLQNKWREQFSECQGDFKVPAVIAIDTPHAAWDDFDIKNSLYGPLQYTFLIHQRSGQVIPQGTARDVEKAFFELENVECVSAVAHVGSREPDDRYLYGRIYRPLKTPRHPIDTKRWLRLRTALFGESPQELVAEMSCIPGISQREAKTLVDHGVDDFSFFATGSIEFPEGMPVEEHRFRELREEAKRLALIHRTGEIAYLRSARGVDLMPLHSEGIYTVRQLLETKLRPAKIEEQIWNRLREEAAALYAAVRSR